jgi:LmbE family N-acetylglucosaminyl deacetylase
VLAPHRDDEVLGCGGTIAKHINDGDTVEVWWGTDAFPDEKFDTVPQLERNQIIKKVIDRIQPDVVYIPHKGDNNSDHRLMYDDAMVALRPKPGMKYMKILSYETLSSTEWGTREPFVPNVFIDISKHINTKMAAMAKYKSELKECPHPRSFEGIMALARLRGMTVGVQFAEAFMLIRSVD